MICKRAKNIMGFLDCLRLKRTAKVHTSCSDYSAMMRSSDLPPVVATDVARTSLCDDSYINKDIGKKNINNDLLDANTLKRTATELVIERNNNFLHSHINSEILCTGTVTSTIASLSATKLIETMADNNRIVDEDIFLNYDFPFTNLVFEGGGNKGMAYVGALQVLEEAGIADRVTRVCGSSVGAITASLVAVGYTSSDLKEFMETDLREVLVDHKCGYCSLLPNLLTGFGWNPGHKLLKWFGEQLRERTGNPDITFRDVHKKYGRELCIVVTNLSQMSTEYFHPKTTPNTPIRTAVRMSTALPGVFQSVRYRLSRDNNNDVYVDGGLLCNYPIHAFDGWWLSMRPEDTFFKKLQPLEDYANLFSKNQRFGTWNEHTLGIMLYSHSETELMKAKLAERLGNEPPPPPPTKLYRKRRKLRISQAAATEEHHAVVKAVGRFIKELYRLKFDLDGVVCFTELRDVFQTSVDFKHEDRMLLFGNANIDEVFKELDVDADGEITFQELMLFVEKKGVNIQTRFLGYTRKDINSLSQFIVTLQTALAINVKRNYVEDRDIERTVGIDTDYIEANDFDLEQDDKRFLLESGARATRAFLRHYCRRNPGNRRRASAMLSKGFFNGSSNKLNISSSVMSRSSENLRMPSSNSRAMVEPKQIKRTNSEPFPKPNNGGAPKFQIDSTSSSEDDISIISTITLSLNKLI